MITRCTLAVTGRTRYVSVEKGCRKFSKKKNIDNTQRFNTDSGILARRGVQKLRVFLGISTHPPRLPRNVKTPNDSRTYEAPTEVPYPLFSQAQKCCVLFFGFFFPPSFFNESTRCCQHYGRMKDTACPVTGFVTCQTTVLPTLKSRTRNIQKRYQSNRLMESHLFTCAREGLRKIHRTDEKRTIGFVPY